MRFYNSNSRFGFGTNLDAFEDDEGKVHIVYKNKSGHFMEKVLSLDGGEISCTQAKRQVYANGAGIIDDNRWLVLYEGKAVGVINFD